MTITCNVLCGINNQEIILVTKCVTYFLTDTKRTMHEIFLSLKGKIYDLPCPLEAA